MLKVDCLAWESLTQQRQHCEDTGAWDNVDFIDKLMEELAAAVLADPRREQDVAANCADYLTAMKAKIATPGAPKTIVDPAHSANALDTWLKGLTDAQLQDLKAAITAVGKQRKKK